MLWAPEGGHVYVGRTNDWTGKVDSAFRLFPRGIERVGAVTQNPHKWISKYGSVALTAYDNATHQGVNEKGLSVHVLYLADVCDFGKRDPKREGIGVLQWAQYYLDNFATVAEAVEAHKSIAFQIEPIVLPNGAPTMLHVSIEDKTGDSAVIEYIGGKAEIHHDRRYTVMTNEPVYEKQIENLKQYRTFGGDKPLPGERKSMDRFVRAAVYVNALPKPSNPGEGAAYIMSVMRNTSVPFGLGDPEKPNISPTYFRTVVDLTDGKYYFESTLAPNVVWIDTSKLDFTKGQDEQELQVEKRIMELHGDVTDQFRKVKPLVFGVNH
ncbi:MAG: linear amide C-N hydrolase [Pirellula sp.]|nr:linear amide C-N hydrolase [Pirellula sp.]